MLSRSNSSVELLLQISEFGIINRLPWEAHTVGRCRPFRPLPSSSSFSRSSWTAALAPRSSKRNSMFRSNAAFVALADPRNQRLDWTLPERRRALHGDSALTVRPRHLHLFHDFRRQQSDPRCRKLRTPSSVCGRQPSEFFTATKEQQLVGHIVPECVNRFVVHERTDANGSTSRLRHNWILVPIDSNRVKKEVVVESGWRLKLDLSQVGNELSVAIEPFDRKKCFTKDTSGWFFCCVLPVTSPSR